MKLRVLRTLVAAAVLSIAGVSQATIVNFEGVLNKSSAPFAPLLTHTDFVVNNEFYVQSFSNSTTAAAGDLVGTILDGSDLADACAGLLCPSNNSSTFLASVNDGLFVVGSDGDALFRFAGFDASFIGAAGAPLPPVAGLIRVQGFRADNTSLSQTFQLAGPSSNGALSFRSYSTNGAFASTLFASVYMFGFSCNAAGSCTAFSNNQGQFAIDNLNVTAVPEPSTWMLMIGGLIAATAVARRRKA